jgi:hypothetical protein
MTIEGAHGELEARMLVRITELDRAGELTAFGCEAASSIAPPPVSKHP